MRVKPKDSSAVVRFPPPHVRRSLAPEGEEVPDDDVYWNRRLLAGEVVRCDSTPTGAEPVKPLTTREVK